MIITTQYTDINATMRAIRTQVIDSYQFCIDNLPTFNNPAEMFKYLKGAVTYKNDPPGIELIQTAQTLFLNNYWGIPGAGDCDCFSVLVLAACMTNKWPKQRIVLAGRSKLAPVHIWTEVYYNGSWHSMDLTQPYYNTTREYKYLQYLNV